MRVALLTMMEPAAGGPVRAHLRVGAMTLARHQLALVLALKCERVVCLAPAFDAELMALQHVAEAAGAGFHVIPDAHGLAALVSATDEIMALAEGLLAWPQIAVTILNDGPVVLIQPAETGLNAGFERIDAHHAAAGAMRVPGRLAEHLGALPSDTDTFSALQRIALQTGVPQCMLPAEAMSDGRWTLILGEADAHAVEAAWIHLHTGSAASTPALALARRAVRMAGPALLHAGTGGTMVGIAALVLALLALMTGWFGFAGLGFGFCVISWALFMASALLGRVERESLNLSRTSADRMPMFGLLMDVVLVILMAQSIAPDAHWVLRGFAPVMLLGLARIVPLMLSSPWAMWLQDRSVLALLLGIATLIDLLAEIVDAGALVLLATAIVTSQQRHDSSRHGA